jgi:hypothetical protein
MPFISTQAFSMMSANTVNALTTTQIAQMSGEQVNALVNSPSFSSFNVTVRNSLTAASTNTLNIIISTTTGHAINLNPNKTLIGSILSLVLVLFLKF